MTRDRSCSCIAATVFSKICRWNE